MFFLTYQSMDKNLEEMCKMLQSVSKLLRSPDEPKADISGLVSDFMSVPSKNDADTDEFCWKLMASITGKPLEKCKAKHVEAREKMNKMLDEKKLKDIDKDIDKELGMDDLDKLFQTITGAIENFEDEESSLETIQGALAESSIAGLMENIVASALADTDDKPAKEAVDEVKSESEAREKLTKHEADVCKNITDVFGALFKGYSNPGTPEKEFAEPLQKLLGGLLEKTSEKTSEKTPEKTMSPYITKALEHAKKAKAEFEKSGDPENEPLIKMIDDCIAKIETGDGDITDLAAAFKDLSGAVLNRADRSSRSDTLKSLGISKVKKPSKAKSSKAKASKAKASKPEQNWPGLFSQALRTIDTATAKDTEKEKKELSLEQKQNWESLRGLMYKMIDKSDVEPEKIAVMKSMLKLLDQKHGIDTDGEEVHGGSGCMKAKDNIRLTKSDARIWRCNARLIEHYQGMIKEYRDYRRDMISISSLSGRQCADLEAQIGRWQKDLNKLRNDQQCIIDEYPKLAWLPKIHGPGETPYSRLSEFTFNLNVGDLIKSVLSGSGIEFSL